MIVLSATTDNVQVVLGEAIGTVNLPCISSWRDIDGSAYTAGRTVLNTNGLTDVNVVPAPAAATQRLVDWISVSNTDTISHNVTVKYDLNGTDFTIFKTLLGVGERLSYSSESGFRVHTSQGAIKNTSSFGVNPTTSQRLTVVLAADVINNNAVANTMQDVTGLEFPVTSGKTIMFRFIIPYTAAAGTTGSRWSILGPGGAPKYRSSYSLTAGTETLNSGLVADDLPTASNATTPFADGIAVVEGVYVASVTGIVKARFASEIASSAVTAKAGAFVDYQEVL